MEAATYGALAAAIFSIWPLAQTEQIRPANLFRGGTPQSWPAARYIMVLVILLGGALWGQFNSLDQSL